MDGIARSGETSLTATVGPQDQNPALVCLAGLAAPGRRTVTGKPLRVARLLGYEDVISPPWHMTRYQHPVALRTKLQELPCAPAGANSVLYTLRGVARACLNPELTNAGHLQRIRDVRPVRSEWSPAGRAVTPGELAALMQVCSSDPSVAGVRDASVIAAPYACGLLRAELSAPNVGSHDAGPREIVVTGKGRRQRRVFVTTGPSPPRTIGCS